MSEHLADADVTRSLQTLLRTRASGDVRQPEAILTCAPQLWLDVDLGESILVDVSRVLGTSGPWTQSHSGQRLHRSRLEEYVYQQFLEAGWPDASLRSQYRPDSRSSHRIDVGVLTEEGELVLAVEVKEPRFNIEWAIEHLPFQLARFPAALICFTNGNEYLVIDREGQRREFDAAPSPQDLEIEVAGVTARRRPRSIFRPDSPMSLWAVMTEHGPLRVVIDFTLPWGHRLEPATELRSLIPEACAESARGPMESLHVLLAWVTSLPKTESVAIVAPPALAFAQVFQWLRKWTMEQFGLSSHIELPTGIFAPMSNIRASYLHFDKRGETTYFDSVFERGEMIEMTGRPWYQSYVAWLNGQRAEKGFVKPRSGIAGWGYAQNDPQADAVRGRIAQFGQSSPLGELVELFLPRPLGRDGEATEGEILIVDARRIQAGLLEDEDVENRYVASSAVLRERDYLRVGDVLLPRLRLPSAQAIVYQRDGKAVAGSSLLVLRPNAEVAPSYLAEFLNSATGQKLLDSVSAGGNIAQISLEGLRGLPVPLIDLDISEPLEDCDAAHQELVNAASTLKSRKLGLFDKANDREFGDCVLELQRRSRLISSALRLSESLDFQISQLFPFPLAYGYRLLPGIVNPRELLLEQLRVAENLLAFLGSVSLALLAEEHLQPFANNFRSYWTKGISPGDWRDIIKRTAEPLAKYERNPLATSLSKLNAGLDKKGLGRELYFLVASKNDVKHDRGPKTEHDIVQLSKEVQSSLDRCMEMMAFWTSHPIRQVRELDAERRPGRVRLQCLRLQGDHPGFRQDEVRWSQPLKKGDLYVEAGEEFWVPLHPYLQRLTCHHCKSEEIYFVDKWDGKQKCVLKSFERGHSEVSVETAKEFAALLATSM